MKFSICYWNSYTWFFVLMKWNRFNGTSVDKWCLLRIKILLETIDLSNGCWHTFLKCFGITLFSSSWRCFRSLSFCFSFSSKIDDAQIRKKCTETTSCIIFAKQHQFISMENKRRTKFSSFCFTCKILSKND